MVGADRCMKMLEVPQERMDGEVEVEHDWPNQGKLEFQKVKLRYRPDTEVVLNKLSFEVKPGEKIGVVGRTGAGKSTICLAISRIVEIFEG